MSPLHRLFLLRLLIVAIGGIGTLLLVVSFFASRPHAQENGSRFSLARGRLYFAAVWVWYCTLAFILAGWNVTSHHQPLDMRLAFAALALAAWAGYWFALTGSPYLRPRSLYRYVGLFFLSFAGLFFSTLIWLFLAVNVYGA
jgi:hypothetical protein